MKNLFLVLTVMAFFSLTTLSFNSFAQVEQQQQQQEQETEQQRQERLERERQQEEQRGEQRGRQEEIEMEMEQKGAELKGEGEAINVDQLPEAIQNRIQREFRGASIETAERKVLENGEMVYKLKMTTPDEGEVTKHFRADGREYEDDKKHKENKESYEKR